MAGLFEAHDSRRFEINAISLGPDVGGPTRERLRRGFDRFVDVRPMSDRAVAEWMRAQEIDVAVDLKGYTEGARRGILQHRPAPVQVSYLGFPGTMGDSCIDYIIADRYVIPPKEDVYYSEKIVRLPDSYQVNDLKRVIAEHTLERAELGLPDNGFVFCCFNNNYKIMPETFAIWMRLLDAVPDSVLWLLQDNAAAARNLRREAQRHGVASDRLVFAPRKKLDEHLARQRRADLFLDTLPYNAHTTAGDALWAGLPVLTCVGSTFAGRVAGSLVHAAGLSALVTHSPGDYEALAHNLATTPTLLASVRADLMRQRSRCPLFDTDRFRRHLENAFTTMRERIVCGEAPVAFDVPPVDAKGSGAG
jgi:protein O-GlcNAc transferase